MKAGLRLSNSLLDKALKRREELREELAEVESLIAFYERKPRARRDQESLFSTPIEDGKKPRGRPAAITKEVQQILLSSGRPMTRGELANILIRRGFKIPPTDPSKYVGTILWRQQDVFSHVEGEGYWLRGKRRD